jgi:hypothetical protein
MATQTITPKELSPWVPFAALRLRVARALAYRRALSAMRLIGVRGPTARLLAREMSDRIRG